MIAFVKRYALYLLRWQLSTPILAVVIMLIRLDTVWQTVIANLIGALIFFWVDRLIFAPKKKDAKQPESARDGAAQMEPLPAVAADVA